MLTPGGKRREETAIDMRCIDPDVATNFFEVKPLYSAGVTPQPLEPAAAAQIAHASAVIAAGL
jgi:hypothetical protein